MNEIQDQNSHSIQKQQQRQQHQPYQDSNLYSAETEKLYLEMKEAWL